MPWCLVLVGCGSLTSCFRSGLGMKLLCLAVCPVAFKSSKHDMHDMHDRHRVSGIYAHVHASLSDWLHTWSLPCT